MLLHADCIESNTTSSFKQISFNKKIAKKKVRMQSQLVNPIIDLERLLEKILKIGKYIAIRCHNAPGDNDSGSYEINLPYNGGESPEK